MVLSMDRWRDKVAIVTGASAGIGAAIAEQLVNEGLQVVALARREDRLQELAKSLTNKRGKLHPLKTDLSEEEDILNAFEWIKQNLGPVHILINNVGIMKMGNLHDGDTKIWENTIKVNIMGLCIATREVIKTMKDNKIDGGHIIHINSIAGHLVPNFPGLGIYPATKYAVTALAETLRLELNSLKSKIRITSLSPGAVDTEILGEAGNDPAFRESLKSTPLLNSGDIADGVVYILSTPPHVQIQELTIKPVGELF